MTKFNRTILQKNDGIVITLTGTIAFFLAFSPIMDPYILMEIGSGITIRINDIFAITLGFLCMLKSPTINKETGFLISWIWGLAIISMLALFGTETRFSMIIKNLLVWAVYAFLLMYIWREPCRDIYFKWIERIALLVVIVVFLQFILGHLDISMWDGRIPGISLSKYDGWSGYIDRNTGDIRPCGIFQEASYVGIYLLVAYAQALREEKVAKALIYALAMITTTSIVAVVGSGIVTVYFLLDSKKLEVQAQTWLKVVAIIIFAFIAILFLSEKDQAVHTVVHYIQRRFLTLNADLAGQREASSKMRLLGNIDLWNQYNWWQKIFGVGIDQYANYFHVTSYSNVFVTTILNSGLAGITYLTICLVSLLRRMEKKNAIFWVVLIIIFASDYQWFNWFFFYLLSACILMESKGCNICNDQ